MHRTQSPPSASSARVRRRGTILIITMVLCFTLAAIVLVLCHSMAVEAVASSNEASTIQSDAVERGAEQYVLGLLQNEGIKVMALDESYFQAVPLGKGFFWVIRPDYGDGSLPAFGLVDECSKLNLNTVTVDQLELLPGMTEDLAAALHDWASDSTSTGGAKDDYYMALPQPYHCKQAPYETVEETLLVRGMTKDLLYGLAPRPALGQQASTISSSLGGTASIIDLPYGYYDLLTVNGMAGGTGAQLGAINMNTAPPAVLTCLGLDTADIQSIEAYRQSLDDLSSTDISWLRNTLPGKSQTPRAPAPSRVNGYLVTGQSARYSADILAVNENGRGFKRVKIVVDRTTEPPTIVYRRDFSDQGWPLDPSILTAIRAGTFTSSSSAYAGNATSTGDTPK